VTERSHATGKKSLWGKKVRRSCQKERNHVDYATEVELLRGAYFFQRRRGGRKTVGMTKGAKFRRKGDERIKGSNVLWCPYLYLYAADWLFNKN